MEKLGKKSEGDEVVLDPMGEVRQKQRVEVEFGTFHEFTAVNKTKGYEHIVIQSTNNTLLSVFSVFLAVRVLVTRVRLVVLR